MSLEERVSVHATIIGGGIIGLLSALEFKRYFPSEDIFLLEKAPFLADHSTGRNSGVLHSGIYYDTNSLKHQLCLEGLASWRELIDRYQLPHRWCGKTIFAHTQEEIPALEALQKRSALNNVPTHRASLYELQTFQKDVNAIDALVVESTGIVDVSSAMATLRREFESLGGMIQTSTEVTAIEAEQNGFHLKTSSYSFHSHLVINAAGLWAPEVRNMLGLTNMKSRWVKGHYLKSPQKLQYCTLYYPVPPADLKGLGVHSTIDCEGNVKFGPDTLDVDRINYHCEPSDLEAMRASVKERFVGVDVTQLTPDYSGIRSKIEVNGILHKDFWIKSPLPGYAEACGIESPGMTSAPAIARKLLSLLTTR